VTKTDTIKGCELTVGVYVTDPNNQNPVPAAQPPQGQAQSTQQLPVGDPETFLGEVEDMDLSELHGKMFGVAISSGARNAKKFVGSSLLAPLDFYEMLENVGAYYETQQLHAKAFILNKTMGESMKYLDECTIDYIEARYLDIIADGMLSGALSESVPYTCRAGFLEDECEDGLNKV
jgi:hypothetical protein